MAKVTVNFIDDVPAIQRYLATRVRTQSSIPKPVTAIEVGYKLSQSGNVAVQFDTRAQHEVDGNWTGALSKYPMDLPHWQAAYESHALGKAPASFVLLSGKRLDLSAGAGDAVIAGVFGEALLAIAVDALASGMFDPLNLRDDCVLEILEFDWMWMWPGDENDFGKKNLVRKLRARRPR